MFNILNCRLQLRPILFYYDLWSAMKPIFGRTIKGAIALGFFITAVRFLLTLADIANRVEHGNLNGTVVAIVVGSSITGSVFLFISIWMLQKCLV